MLSALLVAQPHLDIDIEIRDGDVVVDLVAVARIVMARPDGSMRDALSIGCTTSTGAFAQHGILASAERLTGDAVRRDPDDEP